MEDLVLESGERIILSQRKHWIVLVGVIIPYIFAAFVPEIFLAFFAPGGFLSTAPFAPLFSVENIWLRFFLGAWWLFVWMGALSTFISYYLDIWIVTNKRIVDVDQVSFFHREISSLFLDHIEDVELEVAGFFNTLLGFGTIKVSSAAAKEHFVLHDITNPTHVRDVIMKSIAEFEKSDGHKKDPIIDDVRNVLGV